MKNSQESLYEDLYSDIKGMLVNKKRRLDINNNTLKKSEKDDKTITTNSNYNNGKEFIDEDFCRRLIDYLEKEIDKSFPNQSKLKSVLSKELRKIMKSGNDEEIRKVVEKVRDIILKEKIKFMDNIEKRVAKVLITKR